MSSAERMSSTCQPLPSHSARKYASPKLSKIVCFGFGLPSSRYITLYFAILLFADYYAEQVSDGEQVGIEEAEHDGAAGQEVVHR